MRSRPPSAVPAPSSATRKIPDRRIVVGGEGAEAGEGGEQRGEWRPEIMRDRGQERRAEALGLAQHAGLVDLGGERDALDRDARLVAERIEEAAVVGGEKRV